MMGHDHVAFMEVVFDKLHVWRCPELARVACFLSTCAGSSVVVHGAMSRDATLQLTSLSQVLLDYRCRTMNG